MSEYVLSTEPFQQWTAHDLAAFLKSKGLDDYAETFESNNITGREAHRLSDDDLKEMGITRVGDRHRLMDALETIKKAQQNNEFEKVIWEGQEVLFFSWWQACCKTGCGCCPIDPFQYKLRTNSLEIKKDTPCRCGPIKGCCGHRYDVDNVDLSNVLDADVEGIPPPCFQQCCCGKTQEHVKIQTSNEGEKILVLPIGTGQNVARKIKNQVEVMQRIERN